LSLNAATSEALAGDLLDKGASLRIGVISIDLRVDSATTAREVANLYAGYPREGPGTLCDHTFAIREAWLRQRNYYRGLFTRQVVIKIDGEQPFLAVPRAYTVPLVESAMNWAIAMENLEYLILHAAVAERNGQVVLMPGQSGSGKSTLCAALAGCGWRLLSDEFGLIGLADGRIHPHPRPISLKNDSIKLIADRISGAHMSPTYPETTKGRVAYLRAPEESVRRAHEPGAAALIVFPKYQGGADLKLAPLGKAKSFQLLMGNNTNYRRLMRRGFEALSDVVERCRHYEMSYSSLDHAVACIETLLDEPRALHSA